MCPDHRKLPGFLESVKMNASSIGAPSNHYVLSRTVQRSPRASEADFAKAALSATNVKSSEADPSMPGIARGVSHPPVATDVAHPPINTAGIHFPFIEHRVSHPTPIRNDRPGSELNGSQAHVTDEARPRTASHKPAGTRVPSPIPSRQPSAHAFVAYIRSLLINRSA